MFSINIQCAVDKALVPRRALLRKWALAALSRKTETAEITLRIVDVSESTTLNSTYRQKQGPTNVLSFPFTLPEEIQLEIPLIGDIVICAEIVNREAKEQHKSQEAHWAHIVVHGVFHLLGYDHELDSDAAVMESLEITILQDLGFDNPYET